MEDNHAPGDDDLPRLKVDKQELKEVFLEVDHEIHKSWRFDKAIPVASLGAVIVFIIGGGMWVQSISDQVNSIRAAEVHDAAQIDSQTATFAKIAGDSTQINLRLTTVETKLNDVIDGIKRIEDRQGGDPPGK